MYLRSVRFVVLAAAVGCGGAASPALDAGADAAPDTTADAPADSVSLIDAPADAAPDAQDAGDGAPDVVAPPDAGDAATSGLIHCPASGAGALVSSGSCVVFTPTQAAAALGDAALGAGANTSQYQYALGPEPTATDRHQLVVFLSGSGGMPAGAIASPTSNFYGTAAHLGYHVLALAYRNGDSVGSLCLGSDACYWPTRVSLIEGVYQPGAASALSDVARTEGIYGRLALALAFLVRADPSGGWDAFVVPAAAGATPDARVRWPAVVVAGHSQGGGHAAAIGALQPVARVAQLSSTCDAVAGMPASWTTPDATWRTSTAAAYWGLAAPTTLDSAGHATGDTTCPYHAAVWRNLGMTAAHSNDAAATCAITGDTHSASIRCADNAAAWATMLQ